MADPTAKEVSLLSVVESWDFDTTLTAEAAAIISAALCGNDDGCSGLYRDWIDGYRARVESGIWKNCPKVRAAGRVYATAFDAAK